MTHRIVIQKDPDGSSAPASKLLRKWAKAALNQAHEPIELTIRIVGINEMTILNENYRHKKGPTNVLSFPCDLPNYTRSNLLGDIVICAGIVNREANKQGEKTDAHWAHMVMHGVLHLLGYDHKKETDAKKMETLEIKLLTNLGFNNPYE